ncbi:MAG: nucleoside kinase [Lentisphaerae bacterium]|nr:nucleoside kinase [Lentisphaerota bacterium]
MREITVSLDGGKPFRCPAGVEVASLIPPARRRLPFIGCRVNNDVCSLSYPLDVNSDVRLLTSTDSQGMRIVRRSLTFLLAKAVAELYPKARFLVQHSLGTGYYCTFEYGRPGRARHITRRQLDRIEALMRRLVGRNMPIERRKMSYAEALAVFRKTGQVEKLSMLQCLNPPKLVSFWCDGFSDLAHGPLAPSTGTLAHFRLIHYPPGFVLQFPDRERSARVAPFRDQPQLFRVFQEHKEWGRILGVNTVGKLNGLIVHKAIGDFIKIEEAFHEKKIARIADQIFERRRRIRIVLISGPSAAGKTTFAKRLAVQMRVNGLRPETISLDNYYVDDPDTPRDAEGKLDYEHLDAVDIELFNRHLLGLIRGREIELPVFNFQTKRREFRGQRLRLEPDQLLIVEGIHGLNPRLTHRIPAANKFRIYVSALTQLNIDTGNRVSTTDNRLMRRLVRDYQYRNNSALATLRMWPSVRRGEKRWVFPFQAFSDATFNSALDYELAVLKPLVEPLLMEIKPTHPEYAEARRLQEFLWHFLAVPKTHVPPTSILREYIGASSFKY